MTVAPGASATATRHVLLLSSCLVLVACALAWFVPWGAGPRLVTPLVGWWVVAALTALGERFAVHMESSDSAHSVTLTELPMVVGLAVLGPFAYVTSQIAGSGLALVLDRRQGPLKLTFNLCKTLLEAVVAVAVYGAVLDGAVAAAPRGWAATGLAVAVSNIVAAAAVTGVIWVHDREPDWSVMADAATTGLVAALTNSGLALVFVILLEQRPAALPFLALFYAVLFRAYRARGRLAHAHSRVAMLYDFTSAVDRSTSGESVTTRALVETRRLLRAGSAQLVLLADDPADSVGAWLARDSTEAGPVAVPVTAREWWAPAAAGQAILLKRPAAGEPLPQGPDGLAVDDAMAVPLRSNETVIGVLVVMERSGAVSQFTDEDLELLTALAGHVAVAMENGRLVSQLREELEQREHASLHDSLTGLPNRRALVAALGELTCRGIPCALLVVDLDRFSEINEALGHRVGDDVLVAVGERLAALVGDVRLVARLGSDEFAVVTGVGASADGSPAWLGMSAAILDVLSSPVAAGGTELEIAASVGVALAPDHGNTPDALLRCGDIAMHRAKEHSSHRSVYDVADGDRSHRALVLATDLRRAIAAAEIEVWYQPQADAATHEVRGTEALIRWTHPLLGRVAPEEIVSTAERTGSIAELTDHVLRTATSQLAAWRDLGLRLEMSVNLSTRDLLDLSLPRRVAEHVARTGLDPRWLTLEITEGTIMVELDRSLRVLDELAALDLRLSVDDFGTGYSSLTYLTRLPVHELKIDRSFIMGRHDSKDDAVVASTVELAHRLGLRVVAEGVEDAAAWARISAMGCDVAQGYGLSRPAPEAVLTPWLLARAARSAQVAPSAQSAAPPLCGVIGADAA